LINEILNKKGWSLYDLALELRCSETSLWKYRHGYFLSDEMKMKIESGLDRVRREL